MIKSKRALSTGLPQKSLINSQAAVLHPQVRERHHGKKTSGVSLASRLGDVNFAAFNATVQIFSVALISNAAKSITMDSDTFTMFVLSGLQSWYQSDINLDICLNLGSSGLSVPRKPADRR